MYVVSYLCIYESKIFKFALTYIAMCCHVHIPTCVLVNLKQKHLGCKKQSQSEVVHIHMIKRFDIGSGQEGFNKFVKALPHSSPNTEY